MYLKNNKYLYFIVSSLALLIILVLLFGVFKTLQISLRNGTGYNFDTYIRMINDSDLLSSFIFSFKTAFISSLISVIFGIILAINLWISDNKKIISFLNVIPVIIPHIVVAMLIIIVFSQTGLISRLSYYFGLINSPDQFVEIVNDLNGIGIILAYIYKGFPFIALVLLGILNAVNYKEIVVAKMLKASSLQVISKIIMPKIIVPSIYFFIMLFVYSFSAYEIPSLLGNSTTKALPIYSYYHYSSILINAKEYAMAINILIIISCLIFTFVFYLVILKLQRKYNQ